MKTQTYETERRTDVRVLVRQGEMTWAIAPPIGFAVQKQHDERRGFLPVQAARTHGNQHRDRGSPFQIEPGLGKERADDLEGRRRDP